MLLLQTNKYFNNKMSANVKKLKSVILPCEYPGTFRMEGQALHSGRLRLKLRQHFTQTCLKRDAIN